LAAERLIVFDRTCIRERGGLSPAWWLGSKLYRGLGRIDATFGATSWAEALFWLGSRREAIAEVQFWGHGKWGCALIGGDVLDASSLRDGHALRKALDGLRERLAPNALFWFRTCETLGASRGIDFGERFSSFLGARVAGHTFVIGVHQSGLHGLSPGVRANWSAEEGIAEGTPDEPRRAKRSTPLAPRTITCLDGRVPEAWFARG
jgi:hypothetical protein